MVAVLDYDNSCNLKFHCDNCNFYGHYDITNLLSDNCAIEVKVICDICGSAQTVYILRCSDEARAKELNEYLKFLKIKNE